jgi:hypothetical protein
MDLRLGMAHTETTGDSEVDILVSELCGTEIVNLLCAGSDIARAHADDDCFSVFAK